MLQQVAELGEDGEEGRILASMFIASTPPT
jgi:hypothetical protein